MKYNNLKKNLSDAGIKNILVLTSGSLLAQIINFFFQPIATRLFSVESFGALSIVNSVVSTLLPIATLQYHMGIIIAKEDKEANEISALSFYLSIIISLLSLIFLLSTYFIFPNLYSEIGIWIFASVPLLLASSIAQIMDSYSNRFGQYKLMSAVALRRSLGANIARIVLGFLRIGTFGLLISQFISIVFGIKKQSRYVLNKRKEIYETSFSTIKKMAFKYKAQPLFAMPGLFVANYSYSILPIFITSLYSLEETGFFSLSVLLLGTPLTLVSNNIAKIFLKESSVETSEFGNFKRCFRKYSFLLIIISFVGFSLLWVISEPLFAILYGQKWVKSGLFVKTLIPLYASRFIVTPLMQGFITSGRQALKLSIQSLFILFAVVIYIVVSINKLPITIFLQMINISYTIVYVILFIILFFVSKKQ